MWCVIPWTEMPKVPTHPERNTMSTTDSVGPEAQGAEMTTTTTLTCPPWCTTEHHGEASWDGVHHTGLTIELEGVGAPEHDTYGANVTAQTWASSGGVIPLVALPDFGADLSIDGARELAKALVTAAEWLEVNR